MKKVIGILIMAITACHSTKRLGKHTIETPTTEGILTAIEAHDTAMNVYAAQQNIIDSLDSRWPSFHSVDARIKMSYTDQKQAADLNAHVVMIADSLTWINVTGPFNFEVMRLLIVNDSVQIIDRLHKSYLKRPFAYLTTMSGIPFTHHSFQSVLLGKPFITDSIVSQVKYFENNISTFLLTGIARSSLLYFEENKKQPEKSIFIDSLGKKTISFQYENYASGGDGTIPFECTINLMSDQKNPPELMMELFWSVKEINWNHPVEYLFVIPENYTQQ